MKTVDVLPAGWTWATLDDLLAEPLINGRSVRTQEGGFPVLRLTAIKGGVVDCTEAKPGAWDAAAAEPFLVRPGDLLIVRGNGSLDLVGRAGLVPDEVPAVAFPDTAIRARVDPAVVDPRWLAHVWSSPLVREQIRKAARTTAGIYKVNQTTLGAVRLPVPPTNEQRRIASALENQLWAVGRSLEDLRPLERHLEHLEESVIHAAVLGRLVPGTPSATPAALHLAAALDAVPAPDTLDLPTLPSGWIWTTLGALCEVTGGVTKDAKKQGDASYVEVPYLRVANVQKGWLDLDEVARIRVPSAKAETLRLLPGDVLFNEGGDRDKLGRGWVWEGQIPDCIHQNHVFRGRIRGGVLDPRLLSWHGNTFGRRWFEAAGKQTTNLASLSMTNLKRLPVPVPPLEDQPVIVAEVERRLSIIRATRDDLAAVRRRTQMLRRALLHAASTGRLVDQDAADEPAELVLKRLAGDRTAGAPTARRRRPRTVPTARQDMAVELVEESA